MFKVGDKIRNKITGIIYTVSDYAVSSDCLIVKTDGDYEGFILRSELHNFDKVDSDADSSGLYGVDSSDKWDAIDTHSPYIKDPVYTVPISGNYQVILPLGATMKLTGLGGKITWDEEVADPFAKEVKCQCGALKTYGDACNPEFHMSYCQMGKK